MEQYTGDSNDSDGAHNIFSISPVLKKVEKTKKKTDAGKMDSVSSCLDVYHSQHNTCITEENLWFFAPKLKEVHLSSRY